MRFVEDTKETWTAIQLEAVEKEIEQQKREWEANRLAELQREEEERKRQETEENNLLTYSREDSKNQVNNNKFNNSNNRRKNRYSVVGSNRKGGSGNNMQVRSEREDGGKTNRSLRKSTSNISNNTAIRKVSPRKASAMKSPPKGNKGTVSHKKSPIKSNHKPNLSNVRKRLISGNKSGSKKRSLRDSSVTDNGNTSDESDEDHQNENVRNDVSDDSECSLDVMIDTTDDPDSDSNQASTNGAHHISDMEEGSTESDKGMRRTRSRGTVKINLWSLDPNPEQTLRRSGGKTSPGRVKTTPTPVKATVNLSLKRARTEEETTASETGSDTGSRSNTPKLKNLQILIQKHEQKQTNFLSGSGVSPIPMKSERRSGGSAKSKKKKLKISLSKNHTLDNWVSKTPKISLTVEDQEACKRASNSEHSDSGTVDLESTENGVTPV